ncbi:MAG: DUF5615 family PIN-like protein [Xanthobacteraceae bacterium]
MKVLLDECLDWRLSRSITGHEIKTVGQMGWAGIKNGELLTKASTYFDAFVTVDRNLDFQQKVGEFPILIVVLRANANRLADLVPLVPKLLVTLASATPGVVTTVSE